VRASGFIALLLACCLAWSGPQPVAAQTSGSVRASEQTIKAAYLCKFAGYVEWPGGPATAGVPLTIGVLESAAMADELQRITNGRTINERPVRIRRVSAEDSLADLHILFVGERDRERLDRLLLPAQALPILTVTDSDAGQAAGSIINFTVEQQRVRFEVSLQAAERSQLKLSSRLLSVAQRVHRAPES